MAFTNSKDNKLFLILFFCIFFSAFLSKLPGAVFSPAHHFYDYVERRAVLSVLGLSVGLIPAGVTFWSLGIFGIPLILLYALDFLLTYPQAFVCILKHEPVTLINDLSIYVAVAFLDPQRQLLIGRLLVAFITSFAPLALFEFFRRRGNIIGAVFSTIIFMTSPFLLTQNHSLLPDPLGLTFFTFALVMLLGQEQLSIRVIFAGGIFLGLAIAAKFLYVAFLPTAFLAILSGRVNHPERPFSNPVRNILIFISGLLLAVVFFIPFLWTCPLILFKNIFGTLWQYYSKGGYSWPGLLLGIIPSFVSWAGLPFLLIGFIFSFFVLSKKTAVLLAVGFFSFLFPLGNADFFLPRYALPLIPFLCLYAGLGLSLVKRFKRNNFKILLITLVIGGVFISNLIYAIKDFKITHGNTNTTDCVGWIKKNIEPGRGIAIPVELSHFLSPSEKTLQGWLNNLDNSYDNIELRLKDLLSIARTRYENLNYANPFLPKIFGALEQQEIFFYRVLLWYFQNIKKSALNYDLFLYLPPKDEKLGIITVKREKLLSLFLEHKIDLFVSKEYSPELFSYPVEYFNRYPGESYYIYLQNK